MSRVNRLIVVWLWLTFSTRAQDVSDSQWTEAMNVAARQQMLSQRMSKEFLFIAYDLDAVTNKARLLGTMYLFDRSLSNLVNGSTDEPQTIAPSSNTRDWQKVLRCYLWSPSSLSQP